MQHSYKQLIAGAALAALGLVAFAQTPPTPPAAPAAPQQHGMHAGKGDPAKMQQMRAERMAQRLAALKQKLAITPAQEGAWTAWTTAMQPPAQPPQRISRAARPVDLAVLADAAQVNTFQPPASPEHPMLEEFYYVSTNRNEATAHFRHAQRANAVFADGHIATEKMSPGSLDQNLPAQSVGRLRAEILIP